MRGPSIRDIGHLYRTDRRDLTIFNDFVTIQLGININD